MAGAGQDTAVCGWVVLPPGGDVDAFLHKHKPSTTSERVSWIVVRGPGYDPDSSREDICKAITLWEAMKKGDTKISPEDLKAIATSTGVVSGKWLIYRKPELIDDVWENVARATVQGKLGTCAKVNGMNGQNVHVMCVYTCDFTDTDDVMKVEAALRTLGITGTLSYKPDLYTHLGIYAKNPWKIKPTVHTTKS